MAKTFALPNVNVLLHGGDYNPEQWADYPGIWEEDLRLMELAHVNCVSLGIFSWAALEPEEGRYTFEWMDRIVNLLHQNGQKIILATPTGAKPNWMAIKYPEIRRVTADGHRQPQAGRHNHCFTSPIYREKTRLMNTQLAQRYGQHPAVICWHLSNEYNGECHCPLCKEAFRTFLKNKYGTIENLNNNYWARFWSHTYTSFDQVDWIDGSVHGLALDWKRFVTHQTVDFIRHETAVVRTIVPQIPVTTNLMGTYDGLDYWRVAEALDVVSWDSYPGWHAQPTENPLAADIGFLHDINRSFKQKPFLLMESTPSNVNWQAISRPKRPGMHRLSSLQAVAHGSDSVCYFQWRKSRGSSEKFHGAVVDHVGHENTRVFREVAQLGQEMETLSDVVGTTTPAQVALVFDWQSKWALNGAQGPRNVDKNYDDAVREPYRQLWYRGVPTDVIESICDLSPYKLVIAPMLYMLRPGVSEAIEKFVSSGGTFVTTYMSGLVNENDLVFLGGWPGGAGSILRKVLGIWVEENDVLYDHVVQTVVPEKASPLGLTNTYNVRHYADVVHLEGAQALAHFGHDFYANAPAVTVNQYGKGKAYYVASRNDTRFTSDFIQSLLQQANLTGALGNTTPLPEGISAQVRTDGTTDYLFLMNFNPKPGSVEFAGQKVELEGYGCKVIKRPRT